MNSLRFYTFLFFVIVLFSNCQNETSTNSDTTTATENFDYGKIENGKYTNRFFNFQIDVPASWSVTNHDEMATMTEKGLDMMAGEEKQTEKMVEAARIASAQLLNISQFPINSDVEFNSNLIISVDDITEFPEIKNGKDYLEHTKETFVAMGLDLEIADEISEKIISNKTYHQMIVHIKLEQASFSQQYISIVDKGYIINYVLTYGNEAGKADLEKIIRSLKSI